MRVGFYQVLRVVVLEVWFLDWQHQRHLEMFWSHCRATESETLRWGWEGEQKSALARLSEILMSREV